MNRIVYLVIAVFGVCLAFAGEAQGQQKLGLAEKKSERRLNTVKEDVEIINRMIEKINKKSVLDDNDANLIEELLKVQTCIIAPEPFVKADDKATIDKAIGLQKKILTTPGLTVEEREDHIVDLSFLVALKIRARQYRTMGVQVTPPNGP